MADVVSRANARFSQAEIERYKAAIFELLAYDPGTGDLTWKVWRPNGIKPGDKAGYVSAGYVVVYVLGRPFKAHRLAWLFMTGEFPTQTVDHINLVKSDNRWANLRSATISQNKANIAKRSDSRNPYKGIQRSKNRWAVYVTCRGVRHYFGQYVTPEEAHAVYLREAERLHGGYARGI